MRTTLETKIRTFIESKRFVWANAGDKAQPAITNYYEGNHHRPFISVTVATDRLGWVNSDVILGLMKITGAKEFCVGTCDDAVWSHGVNITLYPPVKTKRAAKRKGKK